MGDQVYAYRAQYSSGYGGGGGGEKVSRTVVYDSDGRQRTVYGSPQDDEVTTYVVETEVTERVWPSSHTFVSDYRHASPPYGRRPQEVEEFLTGVQLEASRVSPYAARPGHGGGIGEYRKGNGYGGYISDEYDKDDDDDDDDDDYERYHARPIGPVAVSSPKANGGRGGWGSQASHGVGKIGMATSNIDEAVEFLKLGATSRPYGGPTSNFKTTSSETAVKLPYAGEVATARPYGTKYQTTEAVKPYGTTTNHNNNTSSYGGTKYGHHTTPPPPEPAAKPHGGTTSIYGGAPATMYPDHKKPYGDSTTTTTNSVEALRPFGAAKYPLHSTAATTPEPVKPYGGNVGEVARPFGAKFTPEPVKPYGSNVGEVWRPFGPKYPHHGTTTTTTTTPEAVKPYGGTATNVYETSTTSSGEASRPFGTKLMYHEAPVKPYPGMYGTAYNNNNSTATTTGKVIDCYEAARKYNGKVIRT